MIAKTLLSLLPVFFGLAQSEDPQWQLVWSDEFDDQGKPDPARWGYQLGDLHKNNELQYYRRENAWVEDGQLVIESRKESFEGMNYTSASLQTRQTANWLYGKVEVRAKLPTGRGMWPAIWMLGTNISEVGWPGCGEIDIMENVGFDADRIHANIHTAAYNHVAKTGKGNSILVDAPFQQFHVYSVEWFPDRIDFFVDQRHYFTFRNEGTGFATWPFDKPQFLIINAAVGGWGAQEGMDDSIFPQRFFIDYVRVYAAR